MTAAKPKAGDFVTYKGVPALITAQDGKTFHLTVFALTGPYVQFDVKPGDWK